MPELPEVENVRRGLAPALVGTRLVRVRLARADLRFPFPDRFAERLQGAQILALERRAKFLLAHLDSGETWITHLGMTGRFCLRTRSDGPQLGEYYHDRPPDPKHTHVEMGTDRGAALAYNDARRFGFMGLLASHEWPSHPWFAGLGPEPLSHDFHAEYLLNVLASRIQAIKPALLDQRIVAGLGNIYVCEALHHARISPLRSANDIALPALRALARAIRAVLEAAIAKGGSTLRDYAQADGTSGTFQDAFRVYDREGQPCLRSKCDGQIQRRVQAGRSSFFCPACQK